MFGVRVLRWGGPGRGKHLRLGSRKSFYLLLLLALVLPLTSALCDCGFSRMKLSKSSMRLGAAILDHLMRISSAAYSYSCVDFIHKFGSKSVNMFVQLRIRQVWSINWGAPRHTSVLEALFEQEQVDVLDGSSV